MKSHQYPYYEPTSDREGIQCDELISELKNRNSKQRINKIGEVYMLVFLYMILFSFGVICSNTLEASMMRQLTILVFALILLGLCNISTDYNVKLITSSALASLMGYSAGPLINLANIIDPLIVPYASLITSGIFLSFSLVSIIVKSEHILVIGGFLSACLTSLCIVSILMLICPISVVGNEIMYLSFTGFSVIIFSGYIAYDTAYMIKRIEENDNDPFYQAINLF